MYAERAIERESTKIDMLYICANSEYLLWISCAARRLS